MQSEQQILLRALSTGYMGSRGERVVSERIDLGIAPGEVVMLMGPNGSGKSTLMHTMAGLLSPLSGEVLISGKSLSTLRMKEVAQLLSLVLTERVDTGNMTVWEVVALGRYPYTNFFGGLRAEDEAIIRRSLEACRLGDMAQRIFTELSDGERQRVMIARALTQDTPLILLDEPTAHLDLPSRLEVVLMLRRLARELQKSVLISTHELELALSWADTLWLMDRSGRIVSGAPEELVLGGDIERVFGSTELSYDMERGEFSVQQSDLRPIGLSASSSDESLRLRWTSHALSRLGYYATTEPGVQPRVLVSPTEWHLTTGEGTRSCGTLTERLTELRGMD